MKRVFIFDLDNTIFPVPSIGEKLFAPLFDMLASTKHRNELDSIKKDVMRKPFQWVASHYGMEDSIREKSTELLKTLEFTGDIKPFDDFGLLRSITVDKFLVTTGFLKMQMSKIAALRLTEFKETIVIDPTTDKRTKKDVFADIMSRHSYDAREVLIIGDDPDSEVKAGLELGVDTVLIDRNNEFPGKQSTYRVSSYLELLSTDFMD